MKKLFQSSCLLILIAALPAAGASFATDSLHTTSSSESPSSFVDGVGVGAIGQIEPKSRVLGLSHDQGPEGALVEHLLVQEGDDITVGQQLVIFSDFERRKSEVTVMQTRLKSVQARRGTYEAEKKDASEDYKRHKKLKGTPAISEASYDESYARLLKAQSELESNEFDIETALAELKLSEQKLEQSVVKAPISGTVLKVHRWPGERVISAPILDIADLTALDVVADVDEDDVNRIKIGQKAQIKYPGSSKKFSATVREIGFLVRRNDLNDTDPLTDRDSRVVSVRLTLDPQAISEFRNQIYKQVQVKIFP